MAKKKRRHQAPEQLKIAGTERIDRVPELDDLAEEYRNVHDQWSGLREEKNDLQDKLIEQMMARGLERYVYEDRAGYLQEISVADLEVKVTIRKVTKPRKEATSDETRN